MPGVVLGEWPMVGRESELRSAQQTLKSAGSIVFAGVSGVGKTRVAREVLHACNAQGAVTLWVAGSVSSARTPFGAYANFLPLLGYRRDSPVRDSAEVLMSAQQAITERAGGRRLVLAVDDVHLLDEASALLTYQLALAGSAVSLVLTVREDERPADPITALSEEGIVERINLCPLSRAQTARVLEVGLGAKVDGLLVQAAWEVSAGNLLYLRELVEAARESGRITQTRSLWRLTGSLVTSKRLQEVIKTRLANVSGATRRTLEVLAVGEPVERRMLGLATGPDAIEDARRHGLLEYNEDDRGVVVRLAHPLYGEVLRAGMPFTRRYEVTRGLTDALEKTGASHSHELLRYVLWRLDLGDVPSVDLLLEAARRALEGKDSALAERLAETAIDAGAGPNARLLLATVHYHQGRGEEALEDLSHVDPSSDLVRTEVVVLRASVLTWVLGRVPEAEQAIIDAETDVSREDCRAWLAAVRASMLGLARRPREAITIAAPLVELAGLPPRPLLAALSALGPGLALSGRGDEAIRVAERGFDPELRAADEGSSGIGWAVGTLLLAHLCRGGLDEAEKLARLQYHTAMRLRSVEVQGPGATALGLVELLRGKVATAGSLLREGDLALRSADLFGIRVLCLGSLTQALVLCGDDAAAADALSEAELARRAGINWFDWALEIGRAWLAARTDRAAAARLAVAAGETAEECGQLPFAAWAYHAATRISAQPEAASRLGELAHQCDGPFPRAAALHACALAARDPKRLLEVSETFEQLGMLLPAAAAAASGAQLKYREGEGARHFVERARRIVAQCEGAWSPAVDDLLGSPAGLSPREMAVARLASEGKSNPEIAKLLAISVRTVESHLASVYLKLGIAGRTGLREVLEQVGLN